jgi:hypothetical protein
MLHRSSKLRSTYMRVLSQRLEVCQPTAPPSHPAIHAMVMFDNRYRGGLHERFAQEVCFIKFSMSGKTSHVSDAAP